MNDLKHLVDKEYAQRNDRRGLFHRRHCAGAPEAEEKINLVRRFQADEKNIQGGKAGYPWAMTMDKAWVICLYKAEIIERETAAQLLSAIEETQGGERRLVAHFNGDEDLASIVNYGRTTQEPMSRMQMRDKMVDLCNDLIELMETLLMVAEKNIDIIMPGYTHLSHAQPITLAHYLLSIFEGIHRGVEQFELAYKYTNSNSGACGACSGMTWPIDRLLLTRLLGFDHLVEPTYDCEASQDHSLCSLFAIANIMILLSKSAMDMNIWGMQEMDMIRTDPKWCGVSSMMPQKCNSGTRFEWMRIEACDMLGEMMKTIFLSKGEPHGDMLSMVRIPARVLKSFIHARKGIGFFSELLKNIYPQKKQMLEHVREGYSCATEVVVHMVKDLGFGGRRAHRIVATFVRMAREHGLKSAETTGVLLDEAARFVGEKEPHITTEKLQELLDPVAFIHSHKHIGGTAPEEAKRMIDVRKEMVADAKKRQEKRKQNLQDAKGFLRGEVDAILASHKKI